MKNEEKTLRSGSFLILHSHLEPRTSPSNLLRLVLPKQPARPEEQNGDQDHERGLLAALAEVVGRAHLGGVERVHQRGDARPLAERQRGRELAGDVAVVELEDERPDLDPVPVLQEPAADPVALEEDAVAAVDVVK